MGFMQDLKKLTHPYSDEEDEEFEDYEEDETEEAPAPAPNTKRSSAFSDAPRASAPARGTGRVLNLNSNSQFQVVLVKPDRFDNVSDIADHLREKRAIVLNLESTNKDVARRLVDFLSGCAYALEGKIKKIAISTYIITPFNVDVVGDLMEEIENSVSYL